MKTRIIAALCCMFCFVAMVGMTGCVKKSSNKSGKLSDMSETECVEFIKSKNIEIPEDLNNDELGAFVKKVIQQVEENPDAPLAISYTEAKDFAEKIRTAVIEYNKDN